MTQRAKKHGKKKGETISAANPSSPLREEKAAALPKWDPTRFRTAKAEGGKEKSGSRTPLPGPVLASAVMGKPEAGSTEAGVPLLIQPAGEDENEGRVSVAALMRECGSDRESVRKWVTAAGYDPLNLRAEDHDVLVEIIKQHQKTSTAPGMPGSKAGRNKEGLTWLEAVQKQDAIRKERENKIAEKVLTEEWMTTSAHHHVLSSLTSKLETVPDKIRTELGLSIAARDKIQKILDETRFDAAADTRKALAEARKKVEEAKTG